MKNGDIIYDTKNGIGKHLSDYFVKMYHEKWDNRDPRIYNLKDFDECLLRTKANILMDTGTILLDETIRFRIECIDKLTIWRMSH